MDKCTWVIEYSRLADSRNSYPWHIKPCGRDYPDNEWSNSWKIIFAGYQEDAFKKLDELVNEWRKIREESRREESRRLHEKEREKMTNKLRYEIIRRDGYKCVVCGRSAQDGVKLHVDHILPISKGGKSTHENLRVLCDECNYGKGAKLDIVTIS